jgi:hypothetical protein
MVQLDYAHRETVRRGRRVAIAAIGLLLLAWAASITGHVRLARLDWTGYDPDPDISQSLANDSRRARAFLPFEAVAVMLDLFAGAMALQALQRREKLGLSLTVLGIAIISLGWHGLCCAAAISFATPA